MAKIGVLLINLGTPEGPTPEQVKAYLKEFLMDPLVIDIAYPFRWFLVNQVILRTRPKKSAAAYSKIWTKEGSPLLIHTLELTKKVQVDLGENFKVVGAMRYGSPSIRSGLIELNKTGVEKIYVFPLYPQYSLAATQSSINQCAKEMKNLGMIQKVEFLPAFYDEQHFVNSYKEVIESVVANNKPELYIFSFHGVPERHVKKTDPGKSFCLKSQDCCEKMTDANKNCYRAQCFATARAIAADLGLRKDQYHVSFQSRLGRTPWIKPYTDFLYRELAAKGSKRIAVICPSFVADCLETLEEVAIRGRDDFINAGGSELQFVPSLNSRDSWIKGVAEIITSASTVR